MEGFSEGLSRPHEPIEEQEEESCNSKKDQIICGEAIGHVPRGAKSQAFSSNLQAVLSHTESAFFVVGAEPTSGPSDAS